MMMMCDCWRIGGISKEGASVLPKDAPEGQSPARVFSYRELATATKNFRPECFLGEGGFGRVYKGQLENGQVCVFSHNVLLNSKHLDIYLFPSGLKLFPD